MQHEIPFFSAQELNHIDQYRRFFHTKTYIQCQSSYQKTDENVMRRSGYGSLQKFNKHRAQWDNLQRNIPLEYLKVINADLDIIKANVVNDLKEFEAALKIPLFPKSAVVRIFAAIYQTKEFLEGTSEEEAVEVMKEFSLKNRLRCCINFAELKSIWIEPTGEVNTTNYKPVINFTNFWMLVPEDGIGIGKSYIK